MYYYDNKSVQFKKISLKQYIYSVLVIGMIFSGLGFTGAVNLNKFIEKIPVIVRINEEEFSEKWLKNTLIKLNAQHVDILMAQAKLESSNYQSTIFKNNKNCFGMKKAVSRPTTNKGEQLGHALYSSYYDSALDVILWQSCYGRNLSKEEYLTLLSTIYAEDKEYLSKLKQLMKNGN
jgi:uncharacterized FlgJ-related protein